MNDDIIDSTALKQMKSVYALDLGTTKFALASLRDAPGCQRPVVDIVSVPACGMHRGMLANMQQAKGALQNLLDIAERQWGVDITKVVVGIAGSHLRSRIVKASRALAAGQVLERDMQLLLEQVESEQPTDLRELLHTVPITYRVDDRELVADPTGFSGRVLTGDFFLIDADRYYLKDVVDLCNKSGLQVHRLYSEPFASASVTIPDKYKQLGVALADIGGGTTDGIVFRSGRPAAAFTVNVAGKLMTNDLAIGLNISTEDAEAVKVRFGIKPRDNDAVEIQDVRGQPRHITGQHVIPILQPRIHELGALIARELQPFKGTLGAGILLTGGGADVKGISEYFQIKMHIPVGRARPVLTAESTSAGSLSDGDSILKSQHATKHATIIGLLNLELGHLHEQQKTKKTSWSNRYLGPLINWIKELS